MAPAYRNNKTVGIFHAVCKAIYLSCGSNFWFEDMTYPLTFMKIYKMISQGLEVIVFVFIATEWVPFYTQPNLTEKQTVDSYILLFSQFTIYLVYANAIHYKQEIRELVLTLAVRLKEVYNDKMIEQIMIRTTVRYLSAIVLLTVSTLLSHGFENGVQSLTSNATFTTLIPIWPDVEDRRPVAGIIRIILYIFWWVLICRIMCPYLMVLTITISLAHQFKNLCKYFEGLNRIFEGAGTQKDKEKRYEDAFKVGIKMHSLTLWSLRKEGWIVLYSRSPIFLLMCVYMLSMMVCRCVKQTKLTCGVAFSVQVVNNVSMLMLIMLQMMMAERTLFALIRILFLGSCVLLVTGVFLWSAGDVTIDASHLPTAIFHSGWHNCQHESSVRVRKLVTIAITQAQERVFIQGLGFIELSYESFVTIVKSSYSLFSVIY